MTLNDALQEIFSKLHENYPELTTKELFDMQIENLFLMMHIHSDDQIITTMLASPEDVSDIIKRLKSIAAKLKEQQPELEKKPIPPMSMN